MHAPAHRDDIHVLVIPSWYPARPGDISGSFFREQAPAPAVGKAEGRAGKLPRFASFREADGSFRFRLFSAEGEELLLSKSFADPKAAGAWQKKLKGPGAIAAVLQVQPRALHLELDGEFVGSTPEYGDEPARDGALTRLREALDQLSAQE